MINANSTVSDARNGDLFAFQSLVDRYQAPIARYMYRLVGDSASVRSLTIDVFVRAKKQLKRVDQTIRFEAWLYRLATRVAAYGVDLRAPLKPILPAVAHHTQKNGLSRLVRMPAVNAL